MNELSPLASMLLNMSESAVPESANKELWERLKAAFEGGNMGQAVVLAKQFSQALSKGSSKVKSSAKKEKLAKFVGILEQFGAKDIDVDVRYSEVDFAFVAKAQDPSVTKPEFKVPHLLPEDAAMIRERLDAVLKAAEEHGINVVEEKIRPYYRHYGSTVTEEGLKNTATCSAFVVIGV